MLHFTVHVALFMVKTGAVCMHVTQLVLFCSYNKPRVCSSVIQGVSHVNSKLTVFGSSVSTFSKSANAFFLKMIIIIITPLRCEQHHDDGHSLDLVGWM